MPKFDSVISSLSPRVHFFVRPEYKQAFVSLFRDVLLCDVAELNFGLSYPILFVSFPGGGSFSVEFSDRAYQPPSGSSITDARAFLGAWIEFRASDPKDVEQRLTKAGIPSFQHPGSKHTYFSAPGGQIFRVVDLTYVGP